MCRPGVGAANPLFSLWRALWRPTAPASRPKSRRTAEESRTNLEGETICYKELFDKGVILIRDLLYDNNIYKTLEEVKDQYDCRINYLKYLSLISIIKSKAVAKKPESEDRNTLINKILNSQSLSKEIYHIFKLKDAINIDFTNHE